MQQSSNMPEYILPKFN